MNIIITGVSEGFNHIKNNCRNTQKHLAQSIVYQKILLIFVYIGIRQWRRLSVHIWSPFRRKNS